jgi:LysM repeat protein
MRRQSLIGFILLNVVVTFAVTLGIIAAYTRLAPPPTPARVPPLQIVITATTDPNATQRVAYLVVTATAGRSTVVPLTANPTFGDLSGEPIPTLDPALLPTLPTQGSGTDTSATGPARTDSGCEIYTVKAGDVPGVIAQRYGISLADLYKANGLKIDPVLRIGQQLIIPANGCGLSTDTPTPTDTPPFTATPLPTSTLAPTAATIAVEITAVLGAGDITEEGVNLLNTSDAVVDLTGWTLKNKNGETFTFPTTRFFPNGKLLVNTRSGQNTAIVLFWGKSTAQWGAPNEVTLTDANGVVRAKFSVN